MQRNKENKDVIQKIISELKNAPEMEYKEGAWERFKIQEKSEQKPRTIPFSWISIAASVLIAFGLGVYFLNSPNVLVEEEIASSTHTESKKTVPNETTDEGQELFLDEKQEVKSAAKDAVTSETIAGTTTPALSPVERENTNRLANLTGSSQKIEILTDWEEKKKKQTLPYVSREYTLTEIHLPTVKNNILPEKSRVGDNMMFGMQSYGQSQIQNGKDPLITDKAEFRLSQRFQFGAFVSPVRTESKLNFGGGLLFGFRISPKLTVRSGLAFNQYEVSQMKDPDIDKEVGRVQSSTKISKAGFEKSASASSMDLMSHEILVPNINSVTSKVQSFEIPLEFQYNIGAGFYASGGASYAKVHNQRRYAHYQEVEEISLQGNTQEIKRVNKTVVSAEKNISNHNFGGFVNLSLGKEVELKNSRFSLSVEPYFKLPIGEFKHTDLNYTNGGVRIITNFK